MQGGLIFYSYIYIWATLIGKVLILLGKPKNLPFTIPSLKIRLSHRLLKKYQKEEKLWILTFKLNNFTRIYSLENLNSCLTLAELQIELNLN